MTPTIKWMDDEGNEVKPEKATQVLISEYDDEGNLIREDFGAVGDKVDEQSQE